MIFVIENSNKILELNGTPEGLPFNSSMRNWGVPLELLERSR